MEDNIIRGRIMSNKLQRWWNVAVSRQCSMQQVCCSFESLRFGEMYQAIAWHQLIWFVLVSVLLWPIISSTPLTNQTLVITSRVISPTKGAAFLWSSLIMALHTSSPWLSVFSIGDLTAVSQLMWHRLPIWMWYLDLFRCISMGRKLFVNMDADNTVGGAISGGLPPPHS